MGYESGKAVPRPSYISPFLRWGVLSSRQAEAAGVRRRDLLWRDFSRLCWRIVAPLRNGQPVVQALPLDGMAVGQVASPPSASGWEWTPEISSPDDDGTVPPDAPRPLPLSAPLPAPLPPQPLTPPSWGSMLGLSDAEAFEAWCTGRTGAPLVDAGMIQLWSTGWMPRRLRLLCAACLVEGMGLDWRLGRSEPTP